MDKEERRSLVALWSIQGVGAKGIEELERKIPRANWFRTPVGELAGHLRLKAQARAQLLSCGTLERRAEEIERMVRATGQKVCFRGDPEYPLHLARIPASPPLLYYRGPGATTQARGVVSIVGTRHTTEEWLKFTHELAGGCSEQGLVVASGGAEGIDTAAHLGTLRARGVTWAFVASGLDQIDQSVRENVVERILPRGGSVFSEYPPGTRADKGLFVQRNRLISGASQVTVVVRGKEGSGARHTAEAAFHQGRPVLMVPCSPLDRGGGIERWLLRSGANVCFDASDVVRALGVVPHAPSVVPVERGEVSEQAQSIFAALPVGLFDMEQAVATFPREGTGTISAVLMELELAGWLVQRTGRRYEKRE